MRVGKDSSEIWINLGNMMLATEAKAIEEGK